MKEHTNKPEAQSRTLDSNSKSSRQAPISEILQTFPNNTSMPDYLKNGIEELSGFSMDDVRVHYNSSKPAQLQALAYAQGTDIHIAPGQEQCLPHEAWHVVQQMAGRVQPTTEVGGMPVNDNATLEHEADIMGAKSMQRKSVFAQADNCPKALAHKQMNEPLNHQITVKKSIQLKRPSVGKWDDRTTYIYNATGGKSEPYSGTRPVNFSRTVKEKLINAWLSMGMVYKSDFGIFIIPASGGQPLPPDAIQIDHKTPWAIYEAELLDNKIVSHHANTLKDLPSIAYSNGLQKFSIWAARMYYHDFENLVPENPAMNASKGAAVTGDVIYSGVPSQEIYQNLSLLYSLSARAEILRQEWSAQDRNGTLSKDQSDAINAYLTTIVQEFVKLENYTKSL